MKVERTEIDGALLLTPVVHRDHRGLFLELWNSPVLTPAGLPSTFVQDNVSQSGHGVLRGLHYQLAPAQGKLVSVLRGSIVDVVVDLRRSSASFGKVIAKRLDDQTRQQLWIPKGCAHGFYVNAEEGADVLYKCDAPYAPESEYVILWSDPSLAIPWGVPEGVDPIVSSKDAAGERFDDVPKFE